MTAEDVADGVAWREPSQVAVLVVARWGTGTEREAAIRAVAGVLARTRRVEVLVLCGRETECRRWRDGALHVSELTGAELDPGARAVARWALGEAAIAAGLAVGRLPEPAATVLGSPPPAAWDLAAERLRELVSCRAEGGVDVVVAGTLDRSVLGLFEAARDAGAGQITLLPVVDHRVPLDAGALEVLGAADRVLAVSAAERALLGSSAVAAHEVSTLVSLQPERVGDPPALLDPGGYVCVSDPAGDWALALDDALGDSAVLDTMAGLASALDVPVVAADAGSLLAWRDGGPRRIATLYSRRTLWDVLASARAVVFVGDTTTTGRGVLECMLLGVPVLAVAGSLAAGLVEQSGGGMVASSVLELAPLARAVCAERDDAVREARVLGKAGREWARSHYADAARFEAGVRAALGFDPAHAPKEPAPPP